MWGRKGRKEVRVMMGREEGVWGRGHVGVKGWGGRVMGLHSPISTISVGTIASSVASTTAAHLSLDTGSTAPPYTFALPNHSPFFFFSRTTASFFVSLMVAFHILSVSCFALSPSLWPSPALSLFFSRFPSGSSRSPIYLITLCCIYDPSYRFFFIFY